MSPHVEPGPNLPRRRPRRKGVHQTLSESELDGVIALLQAGASILEIRETYGVGLEAIRAGLKTRGLTMSLARLQGPVPIRPNNRRASVCYAATAEEEWVIRAYAAQHGMTVSQVVRMALQAVGIIDTV